MIVPTLTEKLELAYNNLLEAKMKHLTVEARLYPLLLNLVVDMKMPVDSEFIGGGRGQYPIGTTIIRLEDIYLSSDEDSDKYFQKAHEIYLREGYEVDMNYCPISIARSEVVKAEHKFIDESMYLVKQTGLKRNTLNYSLTKRKKYLDLTLDLVQKMIADKKARL